MSDAQTFGEMFEFLREPVPPDEAHGNFVFGRADPLLADKMREMHEAELADYFLVTGGVGKDSGTLKGPEATNIRGWAVDRGVPSEKINNPRGKPRGMTGRSMVPRSI